MSEMVHPTPNRLVGHRQSALGQQILDVTQAEGKPEVEPYCLGNDLGREAIPAVADFLRPLGYSTMDRTASTTRGDNARGSNTPAERRADRLGAVLGSPRSRSPSGSAPSGRSTAQRGQGPSPPSRRLRGAITGDADRPRDGGGHWPHPAGIRNLGSWPTKGVADFASLLGRGRSSDGWRKERLRRAEARRQESPREGPGSAPKPAIRMRARKRLPRQLR
jgi:hypothetical protein